MDNNLEYLGNRLVHIRDMSTRTSYYGDITIHCPRYNHDIEGGNLFVLQPQNFGTLDHNSITAPADNKIYLQAWIIERLDRKLMSRGLISNRRLAGSCFKMTLTGSIIVEICDETMAKMWRKPVEMWGLFACMLFFSGLLIIRAVADPRISGFSSKSREFPQKTRNTAKSARNNYFQIHVSKTYFILFLAIRPVLFTRNIQIYLETSSMQRVNNVPKLPGVFR